MGGEGEREEEEKNLVMAGREKKVLDGMEKEDCRWECEGKGRCRRRK